MSRRKKEDQASSLFDLAMKDFKGKQPTVNDSAPSALLPSINQSAPSINPGGSPPIDPFGFDALPSPPASTSLGEGRRNDMSPPLIVSDESMSQSSSTGSLNAHVGNCSIGSTSPNEGSAIPASHRVTKRPSPNAPSDASSPFNQFAMPQPVKKSKPIVDDKPKSGKSPIKSSMAKPAYRHTWASNADDAEPDESRPTADPYTMPHDSIPSSAPPPINHSRFSLTRRRRGTGAEVRNVKDANECLAVGEHQSHKETYEYLIESMGAKNSTKLRSLSMLALAKHCLDADFRQYIRAHNYANKILMVCSDAWRTQSLSLCTSFVIYLLARDKLSIVVDVRTLHLMLKMMREKIVTDPSLCFDADYAHTHKSVWQLMSRWHLQAQRAAIAAQTVDEVGDRAEAPKIQLDVTEKTLTTRYLIVESLVYVTMRKVEPWFKQTLQETHALDFIVANVSDLTRLLPAVPSSSPSTRRSGRSAPVTSEEHRPPVTTEADVHTLNMIERYLRLLCHITVRSEAIQQHLTTHGNSALLKACVKLLGLCQFEISALYHSSEGGSSTLTPRFLQILTVVVRVCCNLSNNYELCCMLLGGMDAFLPSCLACITYVAPSAVPAHKRFDLVLLLISLMCNMVEQCKANRQKVLTSVVPYVDYTVNNARKEEMPAMVALVKMFIAHEAAAARMDEEFDNELNLDRAATPEMDANSGSDDDEGDVEEVPTNGASWRAGLEEPDDAKMQEQLQRIMGKASSHMEDCVTASYIALLIGCLLQESDEALQTVCRLMSDGSVKPMIVQLSNFLEFMQMTTCETGDKNGAKAITKVIDLLTNLDAAN